MLQSDESLPIKTWRTKGIFSSITTSRSVHMFWGFVIGQNTVPKEI